MRFGCQHMMCRILHLFFLTETILARRHCTLNGVENVFVARYDKGASGVYTSLSGDHFSFSSATCFSQRVYHSLIYIRGEFDRFFFRAGASQGDRAYFNLHLSADCWKFYSTFFKRNAHTELIHVQTKVCQNRSSFDLQQEKVRVQTVLDVVHINTLEGLWALCGLLGSSLGVGVRKRFPRMKESTKCCVFGDQVNVLDIRNNKNDKVTFRYDCGLAKLKVGVRYSNFTINTDLNSKMDGLPQLQHITLPTAVTVVDIVGAKLMIGDVLYEVSRVHNEVVHCVSLHNLDVYVDLSLDVANSLIDDYNL